MHFANVVKVDTTQLGPFFWMSMAAGVEQVSLLFELSQEVNSSLLHSASQSTLPTSPSELSSVSVWAGPPPPTAPKPRPAGRTFAVSSIIDRPTACLLLVAPPGVCWLIASTPSLRWRLSVFHCCSTAYGGSGSFLAQIVRCLRQSGCCLHACLEMSLKGLHSVRISIFRHFAHF